jgi:hypothetical protein
MTMHEIIKKRNQLVARYGFVPVPVLGTEKVGVAANVRTGLQPINGVRSFPDPGTTGWFIWAGEAMSEDPDYFLPLHASHLSDLCSAVLPYMELPPGWGFVIAPGYEDVWFNPERDLSPLAEEE